MKLKTKKLAYQAGILGAYHRLRNRKLLTLAMFRRILPPANPCHAGADLEWTMTPIVFADCQGFFCKYYHIVLPAPVFKALRGGAPLITFDNGWTDTAAYAHLRRTEFSLPALVFVADARHDRYFLPHSRPWDATPLPFALRLLRWLAP